MATPAPSASSPCPRRLPCAHFFHADYIARWLPVQLTCALKNLAIKKQEDGVPGCALAERKEEDEGKKE